MISAIYVIMRNAEGLLTFHAWNGAIAFLGELTLAAGACTIAAGVWRSTKGKCWLLAVNGLALGALGLIYFDFVRFSIGFRTIALLIVVMAMSIGGLELATARTLRRYVPDKWFLGLAGAASIGFALAFLRIKPGPSHPEFLWLGAYFGFSAICMLGMALRLHSPGLGA
jgi:uncharacterized membrane protein HdeD (DUF308 family)